MKTKNNVQKAILRSAAVIVSFVLISYTVSAQEFWKKLLTNSSFNEIAIAMVDNSGKTKSNAHSESVTVVDFEVETEPALVLENWMTDKTFFGTANSDLESQNEVEDALKLENWMLDSNFFEENGGEEKPLELENWMTSESVWKI